MKDRVWTLLAFVGFLLLVVVVSVNYNKGQDEKEYQLEAMYMPDKRKDLTSAKALYDQLQGSRRIQCPATSAQRTNDSLIILTSVWGSYYNHEFKLNNMFLTSTTLGLSSSQQPMMDNWEALLQMNDGAGTWKQAAYQSGEHKLSDLFICDIFKDGSYIEIVSPFTYTFGNVNQGSTIVDEEKGICNQKIVIYNSIGNCRITFENVANWFCAGPEGTETVGGTGDSAAIDWKDHYKYHHSIIGNTNNAVFTGGTSGQVIGYAKADTTIRIEKFSSGTWMDISLEKLIIPD